MISEQDLDEAIAECQGQRNPNVNTCIKLAAFYTIKNNLYPSEKPTKEEAKAPLQSQAATRSDEVLRTEGNTTFEAAVDGLDLGYFIETMGELMDTLQVINPRLYDGVMAKLLIET